MKRKVNSTDVLETMADLMVLRGPPTFVRSDNGREFIAATVREWIAAVGAQSAYIEPGSLRENGYCESFNSKLRDGLLNGELFFSLAEAEVLIEAWRRHFNVVRPHSSLNYQPPAPEMIIPRSGTVVPWASAPAVEGARSPTPPWRQKPPCTTLKLDHPSGQATQRDDLLLSKSRPLYPPAHFVGEL